MLTYSVNMEPMEHMKNANDNLKLWYSALEIASIDSSTKFIKEKGMKWLQRAC